MTAPTVPQAAAPRWGIQASVIQPRQPAFWLFAVLLAVGGVIFAAEQSYFSELPTAFALSWLLVIAYAVPVFLLIYRLDLFEREPKSMLAAALLWGGVVAASLAGFANGAWLSVLSKVAPLAFSADWGPATVAPGTEEILKLSGVVLLFLIVPYEFDGVMDGFVYGAMVGLGFTVVEDVSYFIHAASAFGSLSDQTGPVIDTFLIRVVAGGLYTHVLFTGITGIGFAYLVTHRKTPLPKRVLGFGLCLAAGVAAHAVWNSPWMQTILVVGPGAAAPTELQWIEYGLVKGSAFLALLVMLVLFATRSEEKNFRAIVAAEPDKSLIPESEVRALRSLLARHRARSAARKQRGRQGARLMGKLQEAQIDYAMALSRTDSSSDPSLEPQRQRIRQARAQLESIPASPGSSVRSKPSQPLQRVVEAAPQPAPEPAPVAPAAHRPNPNLAASAASPANLTWLPTHRVPPGGMAAWPSPDPSLPPMVELSERLELVVERRAGAWALVRAINGWRGWVDARRLVER